MLMVRSAPGWKLSEIAPFVRFGRRSTAVIFIQLLAGMMLGTVATGLKNGLWRSQSWKENEHHDLRYGKGNAPLFGKLLNSNGV